MTAPTSSRDLQRAPNRLAHTSSPYLLQHAHNPVDWFPWGEEAFAEARRRDAPIFLSIGYSTCYWCHVMERESFEDEAIARQMNDGFVCIKVDREERPDVDDLYMHAVQALTGHGGWPMSVFLEPDGLRPFYGGTYFPPEGRHGLPAFRDLLTAMSKAWREQRSQVLEQARALADVVADNLAKAAAPRIVGREQVAQAVTQLLRVHDRAWGGFGGGDQGRTGGGPKFPQPAYLDFLLAFRAVAGDDATRQAVDGAIRLTLDRMALGGMNDQVGGGFHRYSVDGRWIVPHFEKMLYDNGQLAETYAKAAQIYDDPFYRRISRRTLDYVLAEMTSPAGAFYSAQDAEVDGREGLNYLWTRDELTAALGPDDGAFAAKVYRVDAGPNFRDPHHPDEPARSVLWMERRPDETARGMGLTESDFLARLDRVNATLYTIRVTRKQPGRDDKVLAGWNGLMIAGLAAGAVALRDRRYLDAARRAAAFILRSMRVPDGGLLRSWRAGTASIPAFLEDYAMLSHGLLELHRAEKELDAASTDNSVLTAAADLLAEADRRFGDPATGGYFDTLAGQSDLFARARSTYDGAVPSGLGVMLNNLLDLAELSVPRPEGSPVPWLDGSASSGATPTSDVPVPLDRAAASLASLSAAIADSPVGSINSTRALLRILTSPAASESLTRVLATAAPTEPAAPLTNGPSGAVQVFASEERINVGEGHDGAAGLLLQIRIADGYHITAADPGPGGDSLIPLQVFLINGAGLIPHADYPAGEPYGPAHDIRIHRGIIEFPVLLERTAPVTGRPLLAVRYQPCTDTECLAPETVELDVAIDLATTS